MLYENKKGCGFCDQIIIHSYPHSECPIKAVVNFKRAGKIVISSAMCDTDAVLSYMARQPFCDGVPYRIITHKN